MWAYFSYALIFTPTLIIQILLYLPHPLPQMAHLIMCLWRSPAILRAEPQHQPHWHFIQANWQRLQAAITLQDWSPISTDLILIQIGNSSPITCTLVCTDSSHLVQLSYPSSHSWYSESCGEEVALKQLAFSSWKANPTEGNHRSCHKARNKCVSTFSTVRKQHLPNLKNELSNLSSFS